MTNKYVIYCSDLCIMPIILKNVMYIYMYIGVVHIVIESELVCITSQCIPVYCCVVQTEVIVDVAYSAPSQTPLAITSYYNILVTRLRWR